MSKERQMGPIEKIAPDHVQRYLFAAKRIPKGTKVLDIACGCGYGSWIMHGAGLEVTGVDISGEAISYAESQYQGPSYLCKSAYEVSGEWGAVVSFETLEHLDRPVEVLARNKAPLLIASVPNENSYSFDAARFRHDQYPHKRHYTPEQFEDLLGSAGYEVTERFSQRTKSDYELVPDTRGMFLIYVANG